jgi:hypothetical protein
MPMLGPHMGGEIVAALASAGFVGPDMLNFANAVGNGSVQSMVTKQFQTDDTGTTPGTGVGTGTGLVGVIGSLISQAIYGGLISKFGQPGPNLLDVCKAIGDALEKETKLASLTSQHSPVFAGNGVVKAGSIMVSGSEWGSNIKTFGVLAAFLGDRWPDFAEVVGTECAKVVKNATGQVLITGVGTPPTAPGIGTGSGMIM